jgi:uncharacterized protein
VSQEIGHATEPFHVLAKPRGAICNLACSYCYFLEKENLFPGSDFRMNSSVLERFVQQYIASQPTDTVVFSWHGGEPTLAGLDFYREAVALQKKYALPGMVIQNTIQTNAFTLDLEWAHFFSDNDFLVGVSIDGPEDIHDAYRVDKAGKPTLSRVLEGLDVLRSGGVVPNFLCTVSRASEGNGLRVYQFLRDELGAQFIQFIPIVEKDDGAGASAVTERSVSARDYGRFLIEVFDEWYERDVGQVFVQTFDVAFASWVGAPRGLCIFEETCGRAVALEHNGDVFSCDHFVDPEYRLGNIAFIPLSDLLDSATQKSFGQNKRDSLPQYCRECPVKFACNGGCPKDRFIDTPDGQPGLNYLCEGLKAFFLHIDKPLKSLASQVGISIASPPGHEWASLSN